jgi:hypothetical protein
MKTTLRLFLLYRKAGNSLWWSATTAIRLTYKGY